MDKTEYQNKIKAVFSALKKIEDIKDLNDAEILISGTEMKLLPVCRWHLHQSQVIEQLALWRSENQKAYPTRFKVTQEGTIKWLESLLGENAQDRILFFIVDRKGHRLGHLGYNHCMNSDMSMEIDNVVRGQAAAPKGVMGQALSTIIQWAQVQFEPLEINLKVLKDNEHAIAFYEKNGFESDKLIPLKRKIIDGYDNFSEMDDNDNDSPDHFFLKMTFKTPVKH